jgi:uncharacterized protein with HEPN domain
VKRDYLVYTVNLEIVWQVVQKDVPRLKPPLQQILADHQE